MNRYISKYIARFILIVSIQILVLNNIFFFGYINPYAYILFIIMLPISISKNQLLILSFFLGLVIDMFQNSMGSHAFASVLIAFLRNYILGALTPQIRNKNQGSIEYSIKEFGIQSVLIYTTLMTIIHHLVLFSLEIFEFKPIYILLKTIPSSICSIILIISFQYLFIKNKK
ncbi:MAG: rod shape-determining protein MreD [Flavobacteriales bacterium]|tara:strand:- start:5348 stop:5863 length:516 start_codon:yes stop_codon:yes gene_type:complete